MTTSSSAQGSRPGAHLPGGARIGIALNPIAGMGGRMALHGTDGAALAAARAAGAVPVAAERMRHALDELAVLEPELAVLVAGAPMGADLVPTGWHATVVHQPRQPTTADDTRQTAREFVAAGVDLVLFGGGDGTARDIAEVLAGRIPMLGVPCGVKMHSGVFATGPRSAAHVTARFLASPGRRRPVDVLDTTSDGVGRMATALVPDLGEGVQHGKSSASSGSDVAALGRWLAGRMQPGRQYVLGPGTSVAHVSAALGVPSSLLGVDVVRDGTLIAADVSEAALLALLADDGPSTLILGVVGGQGFLLGRGNQQLSPAVLRRIGPDNIEIVASADKVAALDPPVLQVDVDDVELAKNLCGFRKVWTGPRRSLVMRVVA